VTSRTRPTGGPGKPRPSGRGSAVVAAQRTRRRWQVAGVVLGAVAVVATVATLSFTGGARDGSATGYTAQRDAFDLPTLTGDGHVRLADHRGHPVVVNFFASWCVYCNQELPGFVQVARQSRGTVDFVAVQTQDTGDGAAMAQRFDLAGAGFALAHDIGGTPPVQLWSAFGAQGLPVTAFYDAAGKLVDFSGGMLNQSELEARLAKNFGITVKATDAATLQAPVIPLIPQGAAELMAKGVNGTRVTVIDARTPQEFAASHLQGATNLDSAAADLDAQLERLPKDAPYIVYCRTGHRSGILTRHLHDLGFKHVYDLQGGLTAWTAAGLPTAS
jgi:rhodanese-related sulfurtransferase/thiol-disulfide isomerase/thioredoxin